ncbi:hypothetical protein AMS68_004442 [Peltaster fructicola]|uniref:Mannan endo-1,6-alpha-mannosidase n=1 Tax=Peltaster fructicola TaxID=286661 RepID=A0A6H0XW90_9PEZI|nr:hypothetical protein AMS68_004442 [Peltaster fructicola]
MSSRSAPPWQLLAADQNNSQYWFEQFNETLSTMQATYWVNAYWPSTLQWINAFLSTLLSASGIMLSMINDTSVYGTTTASLHNAINDIYQDINQFYPNEDTTQIFGAAYDDAQWVVLEWLEAIRLIRRSSQAGVATSGADMASFAHRAHIFYNIVQNEFNLSLCEGGLTWDPAKTTYKNAITNELFVASSAAMFLYWPGDNDTSPYPSTTYNKTLDPLPYLSKHDNLLLSNAEKAYDWIKNHNFTNSQGLLVDGYHVSANQTTCDMRVETVYTYNQGVLLSGLRELWLATGNQDYLASGYSLVDVVINATGWLGSDANSTSDWAGLGRHGIMEDTCDVYSNCTQDAQIFKGVYFHHLSQFCQPLPTSNATYGGTTDSNIAQQHRQTCAGYASWVAYNAAAALSTKNSTGIIGGWWAANYAGHQNSSLVPANGTDPNTLGRGRTVETHASGVSVVKAALDFDLWQRLS